MHACKVVTQILQSRLVLSTINANAAKPAFAKVMNPIAEDFARVERQRMGFPA